MRFWILLYLFSAALYAEDEITTLLKKHSKKPFDARINAYSLTFSGKPFLKNPLGEGPSGDFDKNPLYRFDGFDCTTYIETVMALARSQTKAEFEYHMNHIRYKDGEISFFTRNHFPCADWIPNNIKSNYVSDITRVVAAELPVKEATALVSKKNWYRSFENPEIKRLGQQFVDEKVSLPYISMTDLVKCESVSKEEKDRRKEEEKPLTEHKEVVDLRFKYLLKDCKVDDKIIARIPSGSILNMIRENFKVSGTELLVTHQGFIIQKKEGPFLRHVSLTGGEHVKDVRFANYLILNLLLPSVKGIHLLGINSK
jgi:hypothetical protein